MRQFAYSAMLLGCLAAALAMEIWPAARLFRQGRRLVLTVVAVAAPFLVWDLAATAAGHWFFDDEQTLGIRVPGDLPVEEVAFFVVIPIAAIATLEAVRTIRGRPR